MPSAQKIMREFRKHIGKVDLGNIPHEARNKSKTNAIVSFVKQMC